jgi:SH3-like domain-containing protein
MNKNNKKFIFLLVIFSINLLLNSNLYADKNIKYLSLKNDEVNVRLGPSFQHPVKLTYKKKYLPLIILEKSENWRKIKDFKNNSGWIHISQLSKRETAINLVDNSLMHQKPTVYSNPVAKLELGRLVLIKKCKNKWCKVKSGNFSGWILKNSLWGKTK